MSSDAGLHILAFDHRTSFVRAFLGVEGKPRPADVERAGLAKTVIAEGLLRAVADGGVDRAAVAALVDATYGADAIGQLRDGGIPIAVPVEESGRRELAFEDGWRERLETLEPAWVKVLVRFNPQGDPAINSRQIASLRELMEACASADRSVMLELLVPPEPGQGGPRYDVDVRPALVVNAIEQIRGADVTPGLWKIEGFERRADCEAVAAVAGARCVVLGRGQDDAAVDRWLRAGAGVPGFVGFAIGRSIWWDALRAFFTAGQGSEAREGAATAIARAYARFARVFADGLATGAEGDGSDRGVRRDDPNVSPTT